MLKMNRTSKLFNSLALVATLAVSTAVYAMEPDQEPKVTAPKLPLVIVDEGLMEKARQITRAEVLRNLYDYSEYYFDRNSEMVCYDPLDTSKTFSMKVDKIQYDRNIHYFNESFLNNLEHVSGLNKDILALLKDGTKPPYCGYEDAFYGVATALAKEGINLEDLVGKTDAVEEVVKEESSSSESLEEKTPSKPRHCIIS